MHMKFNDLIHGLQNIVLPSLMVDWRIFGW